VLRKRADEQPLDRETVDGIIVFLMRIEEKLDRALGL
jgi:hypothetical protein